MAESLESQFGPKTVRRYHLVEDGVWAVVQEGGIVAPARWDSYEDAITYGLGGMYIFSGMTVKNVVTNQVI